MANQERKLSVFYLILLIIVGFLSGILGVIFFQLYLVDWPILNKIDIEPDSIDREIVIKEPSKVVVEEETRIKQVSTEIVPALLGIFSANDIVNDQFFLPSKMKRQGFILTSDGWIITANDPNEQLNPQDIIVTYEQKSYSVEEFWVDEDTNALFLKIEAENLPVVKLSSKDKVITGNKVIIPSFLRSVQVNYLEDVNYQEILTIADLSESSEIVKKKLLLKEELDSSFFGGPIVSLEGEIVGLVNNQKELNTGILIDYLSPGIRSILKKEEIKRPYLGIKYYDLKNAVNLSDFIEVGKYQSGNMVVSVDKNSPAEGVLKANDVLISVDNYIITKDLSLSEILLNYKPGDELEVQYLRQEKEEKISIVLE